MGMFTNYENLNELYRPNNLSLKVTVPKSYTALDPTIASRPYEEYDVKGELIGYSWTYGEVLNLEFNIDGEISVSNDSIIYKNYNQTPLENTVGYIGQKAYNIVDYKSWTCSGINGNTYEWSEDRYFTYPTDGDKSIYVSAQDYIKDKDITVYLYNFRYEPIKTFNYHGTTQVVLPITPELSKELLKGVYYCSLTVSNKDTNLTIFSPQDCKLLVK